MGYAEVATEMNILFRYFDDELISKIPRKFMEFLKAIASNTYSSKIDPRLPLNQQILLPDTEIMLTVLYYEYWSSPEGRSEISAILEENDRILHEQYCVDNIFNRVEEIKHISENDGLPTVLNELPWYIKFKNICKNILSKIFNIND